MKDLDKLIHSLGLKYNMSDKEVRDIISSPYEFTNNELKKINKKINNATSIDEVFENKVFLYKSFIKLYICKHRVKTLLKKRENLRKIRNDRTNS